MKTNIYIYICLTICSLVLFGRKNISCKSRENQNMHFMYNNLFFLFRKACRSEDNVEKILYSQDRPQVTKWHTRIACWTRKSINTHSEYVILITFSLQQWLFERASMLRYTYIDCFVHCEARAGFKCNLVQFGIYCLNVI